MSEEKNFNCSAYKLIFISIRVLLFFYVPEIIWVYRGPINIYMQLAQKVSDQ